MSRMSKMLVLVLAGLMLGCAQETGKNTTSDRTTQDVQPTLSAPQRDYQRGAQVSFYIYNAPARGNISPGSSDGGRTPSTQPAADSKVIGPDGSVEALASYQQTGFHFTVTIGATEGTATASHSVTGTGGNQSSTVSPTTSGTLQPQTQVNPAVAVGLPGSATSATANGSAGFGSGDVTGAPQTNSPTQTPNYNLAQIKTASDQVSSFLSFLNSFFGPKVPTTSPAN